jgi:mono/diheme cytochrome c family protein
MKSKYIIAIAAAIILSIAVASLVMAQSGPPAPYAGLKNPFDWNDAQAVAAGKNIYEQKCSGCHGATGKGLPDFDFSSPDFSQKLETQPDFYFWVVSEGRLDKGMPPYKSSLSEQERWQTLPTYIH